MSSIIEIIQMRKEEAKELLDKNGIDYREDVNDQFVVGTASIWFRREKWYDTRTSVRGVGIQSFIDYLTSTPNTL